MIIIGLQSSSGLAFIQFFHLLHTSAYDQQTSQFHFLFLLNSGQSPRQRQVGYEKSCRISTAVFLKGYGNVLLSTTKASLSVLLHNTEEKPLCWVSDLPPSWLSKAPVTFSKLQKKTDILTVSIPQTSMLGQQRSHELDLLALLFHRPSIVTEVGENIA